MPRYKLMSHIPSEDENREYEVGGQRKSTKKDIEKWIDDNINACGLDWRAGYVIKFRSSRVVYTWRWVKDGRVVR